MNPIATAWLTSHGATVTPETEWPVRLPTVPRKALYALFEQLQLDKGAEIGVLRGLNARAMLEANPRLHLLCVDPWHRRSAYYQEAHINLRPFGDRAVVWRNTSASAVATMSPESLDFAYIDGDHQFDAVMFDLIEWSKRVRPGGLMAAHDYQSPYRGVTEAIDAYLHAHHLTQWFTVGGDAPADGTHNTPTAVWFTPGTEPEVTG